MGHLDQQPAARRRRGPMDLDVAHAIDRALQSELATGTFNAVAGREDALWEWQDTAEELGYSPQYNWPEIDS